MDRDHGELKDYKNVQVFKLSEFYTDNIAQYSFPWITTLPPNYRSIKPVNLVSYVEKFEKKFPEAFYLLRNCSNLAIFGGAAAWPLCDPRTEVGDVDIAILNIKNREQQWKKVSEILRVLRDTYAGANFQEIMSPGLVTIHISALTSTSQNFKIILHDYSVHSLLSHIDVPSSAMVFDGSDLYTTSLGVYAHTFGVNVVYASQYSTQFEERLVKYYLRGFGIAFPHLKKNTTSTSSFGRLQMENISIRGNFMKCTLIVKESKRTSYYDMESTMIRFYPYQRVVNAVNLKAIANETQQYHTNQVNAGCKELTLTDILPENVFHRLLKEAKERAISKNGTLDLELLKHVFNLTDKEILYAVEQVLEHGTSTNVLDEFVEKIKFLYKKAKQQISWWKETHPFHPVSTTEEALYSDYTADGTAAGVCYESLVAACEENLKKQWLTRECGMCGESILSMENNNVFLHCGHVFHFKSNSSCCGVSKWFEQGAISCPSCRAPYS